jgi:hypothetical protein
MAHADAFGYRRLSINYCQDYVAFACVVKAQSPQRLEDGVANDDMSARIASLKSDLEDIEAAFEQSSADEASLKELKSTVDNIRLSVWAVLTATQANDKTAARQVVARFRIRRATELARNVLLDVRNEALPIDAPELSTFTTTMDRVVTQLKALTPPT